MPDNEWAYGAIVVTGDNGCCTLRVLAHEHQMICAFMVGTAVVSRAAGHKEEQAGAPAEATGCSQSRGAQAAGEKPSLTLLTCRFCSLVGLKLKTQKVPGRERARPSPTKSAHISGLGLAVCQTRVLPAE